MFKEKDKLNNLVREQAGFVSQTMADIAKTLKTAEMLSWEQVVEGCEPLDPDLFASHEVKGL